MDLVLTGATGTIGSEILRQFLAAGEGRAYCLVRAADADEARARLAHVAGYWRRFFPEAPFPAERVVAIPCDLTRKPGADPWGEAVGRAAGESSARSKIFIHAAACTRFDMGEAEAFRNNVLTTRHAVAWARAIPSLARFVHVSTAFVAGRRRGRVREEDGPGRFRNHYEASKHAAEAVVRQAGLPFTVVRPSIVVGDSATGYVMGFRVIYAVIRVWLMGVLPRAPVDAGACVDLVPLDYVTRATWHLARLPAAEGATVHLCAGAARARVGALLDAATDAFGMARARRYPVWCLRLVAHPWCARFLPRPWRVLLDSFRGHLPYMARGLPEFATDRAEAWLAPAGIRCPSSQEYGARLFEFCKNSAWGKKPLALASAKSPLGEALPSP